MSDVELEISAKDAGLTAQLKKSAAELNAWRGNMTNAMAGINGAVSKLQNAFAALTVTVAGGAAFKGAIGSTVAWATESTKLGKALGITTEQASVMKVALNHIGVESEVMVAASQKMSRQIVTNGAAFEALGVQVRDIHGAYRPAAEIMAEVNTKLAQMSNPIQQNIEGLKIYGRSWAEIKPLMKLTADVMKEAETRAKELGLVVGPEGEKAAKQYKEQMRDLDLVGKSLSIQFGAALLPAVTKLGSYLAGDGAKYASGFKAVLQTMAAVVMTLGTLFEAVGDKIAAFAATMVEGLKGNFSEANSIWSDHVGRQQQFAKKVGEIWAHAYDEPERKTKEVAKELPTLLEQAMTKELDVMQRVLHSQVMAYDEASKAMLDASKRRTDGLKADQERLAGLLAGPGKKSEDLQGIDAQQQIAKAKEALRRGDREAAAAEAEAAFKLLETLKSTGTEGEAVLKTLGKELVDIRDKVRAGDENDARARVDSIKAAIAEMAAKAKALENLKINFNTTYAEWTLDNWLKLIRAKMAQEPIKIPVDFDYSKLDKKDASKDPRVKNILGMPPDTSPSEMPVEAHAGGGLIGGAGGDTSDNVLSWLSPGEYVLRAAAVRQYGTTVLDAMNRAQTPAYSAGGMARFEGLKFSAPAAPAALAPVVLNMPGLGSFPMSSSPDVIASLKTVLAREALKRGVR